MKETGEIADIVELRAWAKGQPYKSAALKDELEAVIDEDEYTEQLPEDVLAEIQERQQILGQAYPFDFDGDRLQFRAEAGNDSTYLFCLGLSQLPPELIQNEQRSEQFETVTMKAASVFFGAQPLRIGAPWRSADIPEYRVLLDRVIDLIPDLGNRLRDTAPEGGDAGWDVLLVKSFADRMFPRFLVLGNCATGRTDWKRKGRECEPRFFWSFFQGDHRSTLITFFAVPFLMNEEWRLRKSSESSITFDRFRISELAPKSSPEVAGWLETTRDAALALPLN